MPDMQAVNAASRELLMMSAGGATAQQLVEKAYQYVHKPIAVLDELYRGVAFFAPGVPRSDCERKTDDDVRKRREWRKIVQASNEPVIDENAGGRYRAMCMDVRYNGIDTGKLAMMETSPVRPEDAEIIKALSCALAIQMIGGGGLILSNLDRKSVV